MRTPIGFRYSHTIGLLAQSGRGFSLPVDCALGEDVLGSAEHVVMPGLVHSHHQVGLTPFQLSSPDY